jgi:hypothetical protein
MRIVTTPAEIITESGSLLLVESDSDQDAFRARRRNSSRPYLVLARSCGQVSTKQRRWLGTKKKGPSASVLGPCLFNPRQRPTLPRTCARSTIGGNRLNFRVRNGNGCDPAPMATGKLSVWGSRLRSLRELRRGRPLMRPAARQPVLPKFACVWLV